MALSHHDAAKCYKGGSAEAKFFSTKKSRNGHITASF
jgi:hypothetical protein